MSSAAACSASPAPIISNTTRRPTSGVARAPFPNRLDHVGSAVLNGKIYTIGGFVGGGVHKDGQDVAYEYDPTPTPGARWPT